jgi:hypothetical protein
VSLRLVPVSFAVANAFVERHHRHHDPVTGHRFSIGAWGSHGLCGVVMVGRPVAPGLDSRRIVEANRCCTDGTPNACSLLYGAAARAAQALGYFAICTYTLMAEDGASLRAAGWWGVLADPYKGKAPPFASSSRERAGEYLGQKWRWVRLLSEWPDSLPDEPAAGAPSSQLALLPEPTR